VSLEDHLDLQTILDWLCVPLAGLGLAARVQESVEVPVETHAVRLTLPGAPDRPGLLRREVVRTGSGNQIEERLLLCVGRHAGDRGYFTPLLRGTALCDDEDYSQERVELQTGHAFLQTLGLTVDTDTGWVDAEHTPDIRPTGEPR